jgi:hypothetical protein
MVLRTSANGNTCSEKLSASVTGPLLSIIDPVQCDGGRLYIYADFLCTFRSTFRSIGYSRDSCGVSHWLSSEGQCRQQQRCTQLVSFIRRPLFFVLVLWTGTVLHRVSRSQQPSFVFAAPSRLESDLGDRARMHGSEGEKAISANALYDLIPTMAMEAAEALIVPISYGALSPSFGNCCCFCGCGCYISWVNRS